MRIEVRHPASRPGPATPRDALRPLPQKGTEYRCSMLRDQHFSSLFRHYGKHNGVNKDSLVFFFTEELMQELDGSDTPRSVHLRKNDVIVIRHRHKPEPDDLLVRLDMNTDDALDLIQAYPRARCVHPPRPRPPTRAPRPPPPSLSPPDPSRGVAGPCSPRTGGRRCTT